MAINGCPGAANFTGTPTLEVKTCPECGAEVQLFSTDIELACTSCGFVVFNDVISCINWCKMAKECLGEEMYERLMTASRENAEEKIKAAKAQAYK
ncbi:MAG: transposase [Actinomycetia bacterium]|nr:transposase [Actinomycetes bacterium]